MRNNYKWKCFIREYIPSVFVCDILGVILIIILALGDYVVPIIQSNYSPNSAEMEMHEQSSKDPKLGVFSGQRISALDSPKSQVIVFVASCSKCYEEKVRKLKKFATPSITFRVYVVVEVAREELQCFQRANPTILIEKAPKQIVNIWNVYFYPRVYALDEKGNFVYIQSLYTQYETAIEEAVRSIQ